MTESYYRKKSVVLRARDGDADDDNNDRHGGSDKAACGVGGGASGQWTLTTPANMSRAALSSSRSLPHITLQSPISPSTPSGVGTTAVPVEPLYRVPAAFYGGRYLSFRSSAAADSEALSLSLSSSLAAAAAAVDRTRSGSSDQPPGAHVQDPSNPSIAPPLLWNSAPVEERVRRAAQTFASDAVRTAAMRPPHGDAGAEVGEDVAVKVERGYRCLSSPSSYGGAKSFCHTFNSAHAFATYHDGCEDDAVVPLFTGSKRCRGSARGFLHAAAAAAATNNVYIGSESTGSCEPPSARLLPSSSSISSFSGLPSPSSPAIMPLTRAAIAAAPVAASPSWSMSALVRTSTNTHNAAMTTTTTKSAAAACVPSSPFQPLLLGMFAEAPVGPTAMGATAPRKGEATARVSNGRSPTKRSNSGAATVFSAPTWVRIWASHGLSKSLGAQLERDVDVVNARPTLAGSASTCEDRSWTGNTVTASAVDRCGRGAPDVWVCAAPAFFSATRPPPPPVATEASASAAPVALPPQTLREALLQLFVLLEQLEVQVVNLFAVLESTTATTTTTTTTEPTTRRAALCKTAAVVSFPSSSPQSVEDAFSAVVRQWCEVLLLRWPSELIALGYLEWWMRHPAWDQLMTTSMEGTASIKSKGVTTASTAGGTSLAEVDEEQGATRMRAADQLQPQDHFHPMREALAVSSSEGMRRLFDAVVDAFVVSVRELLRCGSGVSAAAPPCRGLLDCIDGSGGPPAHAFGFMSTGLAGGTRCSTAARRCRELLRVLTCLYVDPPRVIEPVFSEAATRTPSSPISATSEGARDEGAAASTTHDVADDDRSSAVSPTAPANGRATRAEAVQQQQRRHTDERSRVRQLHYQLLYAVCRLCNALPLSCDGAAVLLPNSVSDIRNTERAWRPADLNSRSSSSLSSPSFFFSVKSDVEFHDLFAAAVQLAAAVALPLRNAQLPMKGDLLCVASRLAQQRPSLLGRGWLNEREYTLCMGHLQALLTHAT